ncbi:hypothetical protein QYM36_006350 [Artemia franciscana]|uniref:Uncharacterized protein n=1 Tax=Artemia franciscana TaxID=6661 RepID=A0AA88HT79_ARTSF|nr:hypothetical protein QYM36_006350 [Artemia franciscana]
MPTLGTSGEDGKVLSKMPVPKKGACSGSRAGSGHTLVGTKIILRLSLEKKKAQKRRLNITKLDSDQTKHEFCLQLSKDWKFSVILPIYIKDKNKNVPIIEANVIDIEAKVIRHYSTKEIPNRKRKANTGKLVRVPAWHMKLGSNFHPPFDDETMRKVQPSTHQHIHKLHCYLPLS